MAHAVRAVDGYPAYLPDGDLLGFLADDEALGAWVAESDTGLAGHVALHPSSSRRVMEAASDRLRIPTDRLGVVARLLVAPDVRRAGVGRALLDTAARSAAARGLQPILDVGTALPKAVALYESAGWKRLAEVQVRFRDGTNFDEYVYSSPDGIPRDP